MCGHLTHLAGRTWGDVTADDAHAVIQRADAPFVMTATASVKVSLHAHCTHCVNIEWDTSHSVISVESEGEEENHDTKLRGQTQPKWNQF